MQEKVEIITNHIVHFWTILDKNTQKRILCKGMKRTLVVFIGGCTFAEIAALRFLSQQEDATTEYMVATTSIINGNSFLDSLMTTMHDSLASF